MPEDKNTENELPSPETLQPQVNPTAANEATAAEGANAAPKEALKPRRAMYKPSHKGTFIGLSVVTLILAINGGVIWFIMRGQGSSTGTDFNKSEVTLSTATLEKLGVSRNSVSDQGTELTVGPSSKFNSKVTMAGDVTIAGQLTLNNTFNASDATLAKLKVGDAAIGQLNVNGDATISTLNLRKDINVAGLTRLQGPVTMTQLLTVNNNANIVGNLAVGGTLSVRSFQASSLVSDTTLTIGGHMITRGNAPGLTAGGALGSNGTASISGNDASGTVAANVGVGAVAGIVANVTFKSAYSNIPHVVVTVVGAGVNGVYVNRNANGFSIGVNSPMPPGGFAFDYIVMQ